MKSFENIAQTVVTEYRLKQLTGARGHSSDSSKQAGDLSFKELKSLMQNRRQDHAKEKKGDGWLPPEEWKKKLDQDKKRKFQGGESPVESRKGAGKDKGKGAGKDYSNKKIPYNELQAMNKIKAGQSQGRCRFWNSSVGCSKGRDCRFKHDCWQCGDRSHTFHKKHFWG